MRLEKTLRQDRGVAGLSIFLSLIVMIFIIGLLITIFSLMGGELKDTGYEWTTASVTNKTTSHALIDGYNASTSAVNITSITSTLRACKMSNVVVTNRTDPTAIADTFYTVYGCTIAVTPTSDYTRFNNSYWNVSATYQWEYVTNAVSVINDTVSGISSATDWFDIYIVIGAMVVLILLTVIIIVSIRGSGMMGSEGGAGAGRNLGSA